MKTNRCIDEKQYWPDSIDEVSDKDLDEFLSHIDACPYHARMQAQEDQESRDVLRPARGLSPIGEILEGKELQKAHQENQRRQLLWKAQTAIKKMPFTYVALRNAGREIARCGEFFELQRHEALHQLDPEAGLQVFGVLRGGTESETQLGFFPMAGVKLDGSECRLELENDYVVFLKVEHRGLRTYKVYFRCISKHELSKLGGDTPRSIGAVAGASGQIGAAAAPPPSVWATQIASVGLSIIVSMVFWFFFNPGMRAATDAKRVVDQTVAVGSNSSTRSDAGPVDQHPKEILAAEVLVTDWTPIPPEPRRTGHRKNSAHVQPQLPANLPDNQQTPGGGAHDTVASTASFAFRAAVGGTTPADSIIIWNVGADARFGGRIKEEMQNSHEFLTPADTLKAQQMMISWRLFSSDKSSTVEAILVFGDGRMLDGLLVRGVGQGDQPEQSSQAALKSTLKQVYEIVRTRKPGNIDTQAASNCARPPSPSAVFQRRGPEQTGAAGGAAASPETSATWPQLNGSQMVSIRRP